MIALFDHEPITMLRKLASRAVAPFRKHYSSFAMDNNGTLQTPHHTDLKWGKDTVKSMMSFRDTTAGAILSEKHVKGIKTIYSSQTGNISLSLFTCNT